MKVRLTKTRERQRRRSYMCWFTAQMTRQKPGPSSMSPKWVIGPQSCGSPSNCPSQAVNMELQATNLCPSEMPLPKAEALLYSTSLPRHYKKYVCVILKSMTIPKSSISQYECIPIGNHEILHTYKLFSSLLINVFFIIQHYIILKIQGFIHITPFPCLSGIFLCYHNDIVPYYKLFI